MAGVEEPPSKPHKTDKLNCFFLKQKGFPMSNKSFSSSSANSSSLITVSVSDTRSGHDGAATGGDYGNFTRLLLAPKKGVKIEECVFLVSDEDSGEYQSGNQLNYHSTDRTTVFMVDPKKVEWACFMRGYDANPFVNGRSSKTSYEEISGLPAGPLIELQQFLEAYPKWVDENSGGATEWLWELAKKIDPHQEYHKAIDFAGRKTAKNQINSAWQNVAQFFGVSAKWGYSWTGVNSATIKIALAVQKAKKVEWGLTGKNAYQFSTLMPKHPGEVKRDSYVSLPDYYVKLKKLDESTNKAA